MHLTEIAYYSRKAIIGLGIALVVSVVLREILIISIRWYRETHRPPPAPPTMRFKKLPTLNFTAKPYTFTFQLVTKEVGLPTTPDRLEVYVMPRRLSNLRATDRAKAFAARLGFTSEPLEKSYTELLFTDPALPLRTLYIHTPTSNFRLLYDVRADQSVLAQMDPLVSAQIQAEAKSFLERYNILLPTFDLTKTTTQYLYFNGEGFIPTLDPKVAQAMRVNFFHKDINTLTLLSDSFFGATSYIVVGQAKEEEKKILDAQLINYDIDETNSSTYPLKTSSQAWQELLDGHAYIASFPTLQKKDILVRKVYLAYFYGQEYQMYLQPIFVFEGDDNFVAYVQAVTGEQIEQVAPNQNFVPPTSEASPSRQNDQPTEGVPSTVAPSP